MNIKIEDLKKNPNNPRIIKDEGFKKLKESLQSSKGKEHFDARPCIVSTRTGENIIIAGNTRFQAAKELGWKEVPTVIMEGLTEEQEQEIIIRDNVSNGEWSYEILANEWDREKLEEWGLDIPELEILDEEVEAIEDDYEMPDEIKTDIVLGDLIEIGEHRLLCGDSTSIDAVEKLMNGEKADMVFTDPPYGMKLDADWSSAKSSLKWATEKKVLSGKKHRNVIGDHEDFTPELISIIFSCFSDVKEIFIWGADYFAELLPNKNDGSWVVWDKRANGENDTVADESSDRMYGSCFELCWSKSKHKREIARIKWAGIFGTEKEFDHKRHHPTQKPSLLASWFINKWGKESNLIADIYLGSGSTMVASHQLKRKCYGIELDPKYCQVIVDRMKKLDETLVIKKNGVII